MRSVEPATTKERPTADEVWDLIISGRRSASTLSALLASGKGHDRTGHRIVDLVGAEGQTPLHLACDVAHEGLECVNLLVEHGANVNTTDSALRSPLLVACEVKALESARRLIEAGAALTLADEKGMTATHWLAMHGATDLLSACLAKGAAPDSVNSSNQTPLHLALINQHLASCLVLLDKGASPSLLDDERRCAMHLCMQYSGGLGACSESTLLLLRLLQLDPSLVLAVDADRRTPLHWAAGKNALPCVKALLSSGADVHVADWSGRTPLHWAVLVDAVESASELLRVDADPTKPDRDKRTPLHWAADRASEGCLKVLLATEQMMAPEADVDKTDLGGYTALHYAARRGAVGCIRMLLGRGANRRMVSMQGELPADLSTCDVTKALLEEKIGLKRQRSLSSANALVLFSVLPDLAKAFYDAWKIGDVSAHLAEDLKAAKGLRQAMSTCPSEVCIDSMHVCTRESKVVVELTTGGAKAMHSLTFTDEGKVSAFVPYACMAGA